MLSICSCGIYGVNKVWPSQSSSSKHKVNARFFARRGACGAEGEGTISMESEGGDRFGSFTSTELGPGGKGLQETAIKNVFA